jgi:hypothetical protein
MAAVGTKQAKIDPKSQKSAIKYLILTMEQKNL